MRVFFNNIWGKWANLHPAGRIGVSLLVIAAIGFFGLKPSYAEFKKWRITRNLSAAKVAIKESRMQEARDLSLVVLRSGDPGIEAYRILEKSTEALRDPRHADIARGLMFHEDSSDEDKLRGFQGILMSTPLAPVGQAWALFPEKLRTESRFAAAFAKRLAAGHRWKEAASVLVAVPEGERDGEWARQLTSVLIGTNTFAAYQAAQSTIDTGIVTEEPDITEWVALLEKIPVLSLQGDKLTRVIKILGQHEENARFVLMLARIQCAMNFKARSSIINESVTRWKETNPEALATFLKDFGLSDLLLKTFKDEAISAHPRIVRDLLDVLIRMENWEEVTRLLEAHPDAMPAYETLAYRAIAAEKTGDSSTGNRLWTTAMEKAKAGNIADPLLLLNEIAESKGINDFAEKSLIEAIRIGRGPLPLYSELMPLLISLRKAERENVILEICAIYLAYEPGNPVLLTHYAYLACLNELADPATVLKAIKPLAEALPNELPIQRVLATLYLLDGQSAKACEIFKNAEIGDGKSPIEYQLASYIALVLDGQMKADDPKITQFPMNLLLPSERKRFRELLQSALTRRPDRKQSDR